MAQQIQFPEQGKFWQIVNDFVNNEINQIDGVVHPYTREKIGVVAIQTARKALSYQPSDETKSKIVATTDDPYIAKDMLLRDAGIEEWNPTTRMEMGSMEYLAFQNEIEVEMLVLADSILSSND